VAGATMTAAACSASATCSTAASVCGSKRSVRTGRPESVREGRGATNRGGGAEGGGAHDPLSVLAQAPRAPATEPRQLTQQVHRLVGGDRAGDAEDELPAVQRGAHALVVSPSSFTRYSTLAEAISCSATLVGFLWLLSTRAAAPRLICRARLADSTTSR